MMQIKEEPKQIIVATEQVRETIVPKEMVEATVGDDVEGQLDEIKNMRQTLLKSKEFPNF